MVEPFHDKISFFARKSVLLEKFMSQSYLPVALGLQKVLNFILIQG